MYGTDGPFDDWARRPLASVLSPSTHRLGIAVYVAEPGPTGEWLHVSPAIQEILGIPPEALIADRDLWHTLLHPDDRDTVMGSEIRLELDSGARADYRVIRPDGRVVWLLDDAVVSSTPDGHAVMDGYLVDVSSQRRAEQMLAAQAVVVGRLTGRTPLREVLAELPAAALTATSAVACLVEVGDGDPLVALRSDVAAVPRDGATVAAEARTPDGTVAGRVTCHFAPGVIPPSTDREVPGWTAALVELAVTRIAERERADLMYAQLAATLESTGDGICVVDRVNRVVAHNTRFAEMWRIDPAVLLSGDGRAVVDRMLDQVEDPAGVFETLRRIAEHPERTSVGELRTLDGRVLERSSRPQRIDGQPVGSVWSFRDVTETRRLQAEVREREASLERLVDQVRDYAIVNLDPEGRVASWNQGAARIIGYAENEILGSDLSVFFSEEGVDAARPARLLQRALAEGSAREECWCRRQDGQRFWASTLLTALHDEEGRLRGLGLVMQDITDRRTAELALERRARTLAVVGGIATAANSATSVGDALDTALVAVCEHGGWQLAHVYLVDDASGELRHRAWHVGPDLPRERYADFIATTDAQAPADLPVPAAVMAKGRSMWVADLSGTVAEGRSPAALRAGLESGGGAPILIGSEPVGVLEFFSTEARAFDAEADLVMRQLGAQLGRVVERERAERRSAALARQVARLSGTTVVTTRPDGLR